MEVTSCKFTKAGVFDKDGSFQPLTALKDWYKKTFSDKKKSSGESRLRRRDAEPDSRGGDRLKRYNAAPYVPKGDSRIATTKLSPDKIRLKRRDADIEI